jgi:hypothetical protein
VEDGQWACPGCLYAHNPATSDRCYKCGVARAGNAPQTKRASVEGLVDRTRLPEATNRALDENLEAGEGVRVVISWYGVMVGTDRRVFVFHYLDQRHPFTPTLVGTFSYSMLSGVTMSMEGFFGHISLVGVGLLATGLGGNYQDPGAPHVIGIQRTLRGDRAKAIRDGVAELRHLIEAAHAITIQAPVLHTPAPDDIAGEIRSLAGLRDQGIITAAEFEAKKTELLARM